jgi:hypothetical protein
MSTSTVNIEDDLSSLEEIIDVIENENQLTEKLMDIANNALKEHIDRYKVLQLKILNLFNKQFNYKIEIKVLYKELYMEMKKSVLLLKDLELHCDRDQEIS